MTSDQTPAPVPGYVDLGAMILDVDESLPEADARLIADDRDTSPGEDLTAVLKRFRATLARRLPSDDARSHEDLGIAWWTMGLAEEAIGEFQRAIRRNPERIPAYELLGRCFLDSEQPEFAARVFTEALELLGRNEKELLGVYYYLGRIREASGEDEAARKLYRQVIAIDIDFMDVGARLRALGGLRPATPKVEQGPGDDAGPLPAPVPRSLAGARR